MSAFGGKADERRPGRRDSRILSDTPLIHDKKLLAAVRAGTLAFKDIDEEPDALAHDASLDDVRRRPHAIDEAGSLIVGPDVAIAIWRMTPGEGWLARLFGKRVVLPVTRFFCDRFADVLFAWNKRQGHW